MHIIELSIRQKNCDFHNYKILYGTLKIMHFGVNSFLASFPRLIGTVLFENDE